MTKPWPSMLRTIWGDDERYVQTYFSKWPGRPDLYFPGDGAKRDDDGYFWILGRVDDVLNVAGHRIGTMEVESALVEHPAVAEAAVVGKTHELKGQAIAAFVTLREGKTPSLELRDELRQFVAEKIGALARPDEILFSADLPKTRSGKIMRRLLARHCRESRSLGDTTTLADPKCRREPHRRVAGCHRPRRVRRGGMSRALGSAEAGFAESPRALLLSEASTGRRTRRVTPRSFSPRREPVCSDGYFPNRCSRASSTRPPSAAFGSRRRERKSRSSARTWTTR